jgi:16S rRNA processing protein RimM
LVAFRGLASRDDADRLKGGTAFVYRADLPPLEAGEYYLSDLVGARVVGPDGDVGEVIELALYPTVETVVIRGVEGQRLEQPLVEPWLESVDAAAKIIRLRSLDGLIE